MSPQELIHDPAFHDWIRDRLRRGLDVLATSNQGTVLLYRESRPRLVIKCAMGNRLMHALRRATLRREHRAYQRLHGLSGVPRCYGMIRDQYLVLEYVEGTPYRQARFTDRDASFDSLLAVIRAMHARGVGHGDLKRKSNLLVTPDQRPVILDFGTAVLARAGFHPINARLFRFVCRTDINAWVKHKNRGDYAAASPAERALLRDSLLEKVLRGLHWFRRFYQHR